MMTLLKRSMSAVAGLAATVAVIVAPATALANSGNNWGYVSIVESGASTLLIQVNGFNYYAASNTGCTELNQTLDTLKVFQSMAQAALESRHTVNMYWGTCGTSLTKYITFLDLNND